MNAETFSRRSKHDLLAIRGEAYPEVTEEIYLVTRKRRRKQTQISHHITMCP